MSNKLETLQQALRQQLGGRVQRLENRLAELTLVIAAADWFAVASVLRDAAEFHFEACIDVAGVDYSTYKDGAWDGQRFAVVYHLLSYKNNQRLRVRVFCEDDVYPSMRSVVDVWPCANWFEREAFDLFGIVFVGHPDLRRILTDYGFVGHPFRKDFPLSGHVEMRYDPIQHRVIYQPVTIEPREITPRIIREENYGG